MSGQQIRLPRLEAEWKWPRLVSPYLAEIEKECLEWSASFTAFDEKTQSLVHEKGKLKQVKSGCDLMHLFFMFDEYSDKSTPEEVLLQAQSMIDSLNNPDKPRPEDEWIGAEITRQFWLRLPQTATETFRRRFWSTWVDYVQSVAKQAEYRSTSRILDLEEFLAVRRHTSGAPSTIALYEMDSDIPDHIRQHPVIQELEVLAIDLILIDNDVVSYNKEQAVGDDEHNIVTIFMCQHRLSIQEAMDRAGELAQGKMERFYELYRQVPRYTGPIDLDVQTLVDGMAQCVGGVMHWSYESQRYFGNRGPEIKKSRLIRLLPKIESRSDVGPIPIDDGWIA